MSNESSAHPIILDCGHEVLDPNQCHYCSYIQDPLIKELVRPKSIDGEPRSFEHPDEFQFILVHQACELSFEGCLVEMDRAIKAINTRDFVTAKEYVSRCRSWVQIAARQLQHLVDHLTPEDFSFFRHHLSPASGAESIRFRLIELCSGIKPDSPYVAHRGHVYSFRDFLDRTPMEGVGRPKTRWWTEAMSHQAKRDTLRSSFVQVAQTAGYSVNDLELSSPETIDACTHLLQSGDELSELAHTLIRFERALLSLRRVHLNAALRHISETPGTGHTDGVAYLRSVLETARCFPALNIAHEHIEMGAKK